ncbi:hypothetical protein [Sphingobacterium athyrii]|nr:hypothetical protein [Sphingobacterium athyrii]
MNTIENRDFMNNALKGDCKNIQIMDIVSGEYLALETMRGQYGD